MTEAFPDIPGYQIQKRMGQGGMATVYLAVQESFGRQVALKIMSDQLGKDDVWAQRFMHEARIVAQLSHSNIVPVFDVGSHEGQFYISMELLKGGKLDERMTAGLPVPEAVRIVCGVASGLDYAGSKGFIHRDIKPDNIMFRDDGTPVILDFGIAKQKDGDSKMTKTGTIVGTTGYMSPEQAMGQELDERSDIYSLGIMLYELLTGVVPFRGDSAVAVLMKHVQEVPPPLPGNLGVFQPALDKALAKKPEDRYERASQMAEHLQQLLNQYKAGHSDAEMPATQILNSLRKTGTAPLSRTISTAPASPPSQAIRWWAISGLALLAVAAIAVWQLKPKPAGSPPIAVQEAVAVPERSAAPGKMEVPDHSAAITHILQGARDCLERYQYDCAKSKAESALDLDPGNQEAQQIHDTAEKAQKAAFAGDWDAQ